MRRENRPFSFQNPSDQKFSWCHQQRAIDKSKQTSCRNVSGLTSAGLCGKHQPLDSHEGLHIQLTKQKSTTVFTFWKFSTDGKVSRRNAETRMKSLLWKNACVEKLFWSKLENDVWLFTRFYMICLWNMCFKWLSATTTPNFSSISLKLVKFWLLLYFLKSVVFGIHLELNRLDVKSSHYNLVNDSWDILLKTQAHK